MLLILSVCRPGPLADKQRGSINNATRLDKQRGCRLKLSTRKAFVATHKNQLALFISEVVCFAVESWWPSSHAVVARRTSPPP